MRTRAVLLLCFSLLTTLNLLAQENLRPGATPRTHFNEPLNKTVATLNNGPLVVAPLQNLNDIITTLFGPGITVSNLTYTGAPIAIGMFYDTTGTLGIDTGIIMTNGSINIAPGPNNSPSAGIANGLPGDPDLSALIGGTATWDASIIEFDFTPLTDTLIAAKIIFASEEYPEYVGTGFNDVFGFFGNGQGFTTNENIAVVGPNNSNISINSINDMINSQFYIDNAGGYVIQYDGYTTVFSLMHPIIPGQPYHFKIAIADASDHIYDAAVFMKAKSFLGYACVPNPGFNVSMNNNTASFTNTTNYAKEWNWDFGDGSPNNHDKNPVHTYALTGTYHVTLQAVNYYQLANCSHDIAVGATSIVQHATEPVISLKPLSHGLFHVSINQIVNGDALIEVLDITGQKIQSQHLSGNTIEENIDLREKPSGVYIIRITTENGVYARKVVR